MHLRTASAPALAALLAFAPAFAHEDEAQDARSTQKLGSVHFPTSCAKSVQPDFERGVALLHSFWFPEGFKTFSDVLKRDPSCTMAYWGIGVNRLLNPLSGAPDEQFALQGREAVEKGLAQIEKAGAATERERDYLAAIGTFYLRGGAPWKARVLRYEQAMEKLAAKYPQDKEAAIFYALALNIAIDKTDKTFARQLKAARILEPIFAEQPEHPGVAHYLIHSYDYPPIAEKGLQAARRYAAIAPAAAHASHMPSHIFTRVGAWEDSLATNQRSEGVARKNNTPDESLHALDYQIYAALQLAKDGYARDALVRVKADAPKAERQSGAYSEAMGPARYALERGDWKTAAALEVRPSKWIFATANTLFARGYAAARLGDAQGAAREAAELGKLSAELEKQQDKYWASEADVQRLTVLAWAALARGEREAAPAQMRQAADLEDLSERSGISPGRILPAREMLGEMLLALGQPAEALKHFEASATRDPNRFRGYHGAALAAQRSGDQTKAKAYFTKLAQLAAKGDPRPELEQARTYLAAK